MVRPAKIRWLGQRLRPYPHPVAVELDFVTDASAFLQVAGAFLVARPVLNTVVATVAHRTAAGAEPACDGDWWLVVRGGSGHRRRGHAYRAFRASSGISAADAGRGGQSLGSRAA